MYWLIFYLVGVIAMFSLVLIANRHISRKGWKLKAAIKTLAVCLGSWIAVYALAVKAIISN